MITKYDEEWYLLRKVVILVQYGNCDTKIMTLKLFATVYLIQDKLSGCNLIHDKEQCEEVTEPSYKSKMFSIEKVLYMHISYGQNYFFWSKHIRKIVQ